MKKKYVPNQKEIEEVIKRFELSEEDATMLLKITGPNIDSINNYFKGLKHGSFIHHYSKTCLRCGRPLKSFQSRLDGYGSGCKRKMEERVRFQKINLVGVNYAEQGKAGNSSK